MKRFAAVSSIVFVAMCLVCPQVMAASTTYTCSPIADTRLDQRDPDINFGDGTTIKIVGDPLGAEVVRGLIRFNIPPFISPAQIQSAVMHLNARKAFGSVVAIYPVQAYWGEKDLYEDDNMTIQMYWGATWNQAGGDDPAMYPWGTAGGDYDSSSSTSFTIVGDWNAVDITTFLTDNLDAVRKYGVLIKMQDETLDEFCSIYSSDNDDSNPYLELTVDLGLPAGTYLCPAIQDVYLDEGRSYNLNWKTRVLVSYHPTYGTSRGLWQFDIPGEIEASQIADATMYLSGSEHALSTKSFDIDVFALNVPFDEETDTWASLSNGGDYDTGVLAAGHLPGTFNPEVTNWYAEIDVTSLLAGNLDKVRDNGVLIKQSPEGPDKLHQNIASREAYDETDVPAYLEIVTEATVVDLSSFEAVPGSNKVTLTWTTESEIDNAGFNIYRSEDGGAPVKVNDAIIAAEGNADSGAVYSFVDRNVQNRVAYTYILEDLDLEGTATRHGPVGATPRLLYLFR